MKSETLDDKELRGENARAQEALRISEERNRDLVENSAYGIFRVSADGSFLDANPTLMRITGCASAVAGTRYDEHQMEMLDSER